VVQLADGDLGDVGHEVVGDAGGVLADASGRMRADRVEVAQLADAPTVVGSIKVIQNLLDHHFGAAIGVADAANFHVLHQRRNVVGAVNRSRGAEHNAADVVRRHHLKQCDGAGNIVVKVFERDVARFADGLEPGKVNHRINFLLGENFVQPGTVADIAVVKHRRSPGKLLDTLQNHRFAVVVVVGDHDIIARFHQGDASVAADVPGTAGYEN